MEKLSDPQFEHTMNITIVKENHLLFIDFLKECKNGNDEHGIKIWTKHLKTFCQAIDNYALRKIGRKISIEDDIGSLQLTDEEMNLFRNKFLSIGVENSVPFINFSNFILEWINSQMTINNAPEFRLRQTKLYADNNLRNLFENCINSI